MITPENQVLNARTTADSVFLPVGFIDLEATLDGGQAFRWWRQQDGAYRGVVGRRVVTIIEADGGLLIRPADGKDSSGLGRSLSDYLGHDQDLDGFRARFADDPWECLFSFICSSTSNIPRIKLNVGAVSEMLGFLIGPEPHDVTFPEPEAIAECGEQFLRDLGLGFRAKYLVPAAEAVASGELNLSVLREAPYAEARNALTELHGVGEKVADCVLAFSLDKPESFIVDRHILRALLRWYDVPEKASLTYAANWARDYFGEHAALANQYMFHRERLARRATEWGGAHISRALPEDGR